MKFVCEHCHTAYDSAELAVKCEEEHVAAEERRRKGEDERKSYEDTISDAYNAFIAKYGAAPVITLTEESERIMLKEFRLPSLARLLGL